MASKRKDPLLVIITTTFFNVAFSFYKSPLSETTLQTTPIFQAWGRESCITIPPSDSFARATAY